MVESRNTKGEALPSQGGGLLCHSALQWRGGHVVRGADRVTLPAAPSDPHHHHHTDSAIIGIRAWSGLDPPSHVWCVKAPRLSE